MDLDLTAATSPLLKILVKSNQYGFRPKIGLLLFYLQLYRKVKSNQYGFRPGFSSITLRASIFVKSNQYGFRLRNPIYPYKKRIC